MVEKNAFTFSSLMPSILLFLFLLYNFHPKIQMFAISKYILYMCVYYNKQFNYTMFCSRGCLWSGIWKLRMQKSFLELITTFQWKIQGTKETQEIRINLTCREVGGRVQRRKEGIGYDIGSGGWLSRQSAWCTWMKAWARELRTKIKMPDTEAHCLFQNWGRRGNVIPRAWWPQIWIITEQ